MTTMAGQHSRLSSMTTRAEVGRCDGGQSQVDEADSKEAAIRQGFYDFFDDSFAGRSSKLKLDAYEHTTMGDHSGLQSHQNTLT
jgi:hypothetical protein